VETRIEKATGVYIHFPFCRRCCFYCHFVKHPYEQEPADAYIRALIREIRLKTNHGLVIDSIYFGGGSPSLLSGSQLGEIMEELSRHYRISRDAEISLEANPEDIEPQKLKEFVSLGINRLSLGVQSFNCHDLDYLGRNHTIDQSLEAIGHARSAGLENLNIDFIISLPGQTRVRLEENFTRAAQLEIPHISAYILEGVMEGEEKDRRDHELYFFTREFLGNLGYDHYEVSNFSKGPARRSRHNLKYWQNLEYMALGLGASGFEESRDYKNYADFPSYYQSIEEGKLPIQESSFPDLKIRRIVMGLRLFQGIHRSAFEDYPGPLEMLLANGVLIRSGKNLAVAPEKMLLLNEILTYFL